MDPTNPFLTSTAMPLGNVAAPQVVSQTPLPPVGPGPGGFQLPAMQPHQGGFFGGNMQALMPMIQNIQQQFPQQWAALMQQPWAAHALGRLNMAQAGAPAYPMAPGMPQPHMPQQPLPPAAPQMPSYGGGGDHQMQPMGQFPPSATIARPQNAQGFGI